MTINNTRGLILILIIFICGDITAQIKSKEESFILPEVGFNTTSHFPDSIELLPIKIYENSDTNKSCQSFLLVEYFISEHTKDIIQNHLAKYQASDDSLLVVENHRIGTFTKRYKPYRDFNMSLGYYPIPFFERKEYNHPEDVVCTNDVYSDNTSSGLSEDFVVYILDSQAGIYSDKISPLTYMPDNWKNGYSKGVCINEKRKIVIYWTLIW